MSDVSWDDDEFEPKEAAPALPSDKWDGEDEDDIKDNWDDEEERPATTTTTTSTITTVAKKKKKKLVDIIALKEAKQQEELERRQREKEEGKEKESAAGKLAEKLRLQKVQEDADLKLASELMMGQGGGQGGTPATTTTTTTTSTTTTTTATAEDGEEGNATTATAATAEEGEGDGEEDGLAATTTTTTTAAMDSLVLEGLDLDSAEGLTSLRRSLVAKVRQTERLEKKPAYVVFVEDITRDLCMNLEMDEVKRVTAVLNTLYNEKMRANKPKSKKKQLGKAKLNQAVGPLVDDFSADYDDFI